MPSRSGTRNDRYDDPYVYDDPYLHSNSSIGGNGAPAYEYVGTEEASIAPDPPRHTFSPDHNKRAPSPPRRSRYDNAYSPPQRERSRKHSDPPPRASRRPSPQPRDEKKASKDRHQRYHEFAQKPSVQRTKSLGRQGLSFLGEAAAAYAAAQAGGAAAAEPPPSRSRHSSPEPRRSRRSRRHSRSPSSSPSRSPPRRRTTMHGDRHRPRTAHHKSYSASPPPVSRRSESDRDRDRDRGRHQKPSRPRSSNRSPSPSRRSRHRGRSGPSTTSGFRSGMRSEYSHGPDSATATRWQMAARAALEAGGLTAFRLRKEPGSWTGEKGAKIATAALGAAAIDAFIDKDPRRSKSHGRGVKG
ncbi:hypothetical protein F4809DRAFT_400792 [Biscogniauxia mediterranea]|nr:hypothetical protein F4809DRAFT_400792 [Biscogniauxia mediterranea]